MVRCRCRTPCRRCSKYFRYRCCSNTNHSGSSNGSSIRRGCSYHRGSCNLRIEPASEKKESQGGKSQRRHARGEQRAFRRTEAGWSPAALTVALRIGTLVWHLVLFGLFLDRRRWGFVLSPRSDREGAKKGKERERGALPLFRGNEISIWTFPEFFRVFSPLKPSYPRTETCRGHLTGSDTDREDSERGRPEPCPNRIRSTGVDRSTVDGRESSPLDREHTRWVGRSVTSRVEVASRSGPVAYGLCLLKGGRDQAAGLLHSL